MTQLVRDLVGRLVRKTGERSAALARLDEVLRASRVEVGRRAWKREDLYKR